MQQSCYVPIQSIVFGCLADMDAQQIRQCKEPDVVHSQSLSLPADAGSGMCEQWQLAVEMDIRRAACKEGGDMLALKSPVMHSRFDWIVKPEVQFVEFGESEHDVPIPIPMPEEIGQSSLKSMHLPMNIVIYYGYHHFISVQNGRLLPLGEFKLHLAEPVFVIHSARIGQTIFSDRRVGKNLLFGSKTGTLFQYVDVLDYLATLDCSENIEIVAIVIGESVLVDMLGLEHSQSMLRGLQVSLMPSASVNKVPRHIDAILHSCLPRHLTGNISKLFAQAKVLEYICALAEYVSVNETGKLQTETGRRMQLQQLHDELEVLQGKTPTLDELARQYGMSARVLNDEFKKIYGSSIFTYISELRLSEAHEALLKTDIPMKTIAINMGYSHVNHFISAFGKKFGYSPGSLRRK